MVNQLNRAIDDVINCIVESFEYKKCMAIKEQMMNNSSLMELINNIKKLSKNSIYSYGNNGIYSDEILSNDNTIINRISNNKSIYCLSKDKNSDTLTVCNKNNMYVVIPNIIGDYADVKNNISNGSIILLNNINNLDIIIKYIKSKGYDIVPLEELLTEQILNYKFMIN